MSIRSDIGIALKWATYNALSDEVKAFLKGGEDYTNTKAEHPEGICFYIEDFNHWATDEMAMKLYSELKTCDSDLYLIVEACHDYPEYSEEYDRGCWVDNPFDLHKIVTVALHFNFPT